MSHRRTVVELVGETAADLAALVWPVACAGCGVSDRELCAHCRSVLADARPLTLTSALAPVPVYARGPYNGVLRATIVAYKHGGRTGLARPLGAQFTYPLRLALRHAGAAPLIVAAPSRAATVRRRGFRPVETLLTAALRVDPGPTTPVRALTATRGRRGQVGLDALARDQNAARIAVRASQRELLRGRDVVVIDDIMTTGATVRAACAVLAAEGARVTAVAVLAVVAHVNTAT